MGRRQGLLLPIEVTYDEYAVDIAENQILRSAMRRLSQVRRLSPALSSRLGHLDARLEGTTIVMRGTPLPAWRPSRLNARYLPALRLSEVVLRNVGLSTASGAAPVASFVVDMATVFEDFVSMALAEAFGRISVGRTRSQHRSHLDVDRLVPVVPDVVHTVDDRPVAVLDAKYKLGDASGRYPNADLYQMLAYCTVLGLDRGWLVYAGSRTEHARSVARRVRNTIIDNVEYPLDVSCSPTEMLGQVAALATYALRPDIGVLAVLR
jgi:5-methylcytosine-specific restriction enzyme subunit McrC